MPLLGLRLVILLVLRLLQMPLTMQQAANMTAQELLNALPLLRTVPLPLRPLLLLLLLLMEWHPPRVTAAQ